MILEDEEFHTHSWLTYKECLQVNKLYKKQEDEWNGYVPFTLQKKMDHCYPCDISDKNFRVVFAFDN